jgi:hypothetical protein
LIRRAIRIVARGVRAAAAVIAVAGAAAAQGTGAGPAPITIPPAQVPTEGGSEAPHPPLTMRALLPTDVQVLRDARGAGMVMYGPLAGKAASALAVLQGVFTYSQAFDPIPALPLVLVEADDRRAEALFTAAVNGAAVVGIAAVRLNDAGGTVSVFYNYPDKLAASFPRLRQALEQSDGAATAMLTPLRLADGSQVGVPAGWRLIGQGARLVDLMGTQGEFVSLGAASAVHANPVPPGATALQAPCCDPVKALQAVYPQLNANAQHLGSPAQLLTQIVESQSIEAGAGAQAAFVLSRLAVGGRPYWYFALVQTIRGFSDPWTMILSGVTAPQPVFAAELPMLLQVWRSYSDNPPDFAERLKGSLQDMPATRQMLQLATGPHRPGSYGADAGWAVLLDDLPKDKDAPIDAAAAQALVDKLSSDTGQPWRIVPPSELK